MRTITFGCPGREEVFTIDVVVADAPAGGSPWITPEQFARYRDLAVSSGGEVPLTPEEFEALVAGDPGRLAALASVPASNLYPLFQRSLG